MNSIVYSTALKHTANPQWVHSLLARVVSRPPFSSTAFLKQFHWLPLEWCIQFKLATLTFKALHTGCLPYLTHPLATSSAHEVFTHPLLISYLFRDTTNHLDLVPSAFQPQKSGTPASLHLRISSHFHFLLLNIISRLNFFQLTYPTP